MHLEKLYNKVANTYNQDVSGHVLNASKQKALELALKQCRSFNSILALGMGDGTDLFPYIKHYPFAELHGLDISENMLEKARQLLNCHTYHGDINHATRIVDKRNFDLITAHFVTAYVPLTTVLAECKQLTSKQGLVSIVTNTMDSFPVAHSILAKLKASPNPFIRLIVHHIQKTLKTVHVPQDLAKLKQVIEANGFKLIALAEEKIEVDFDSEKAIFDFFINGGWFVSGMGHPLLTYELICKICHYLIHKYFPIPYNDQMTIAIAIAERL